MRHFSRILFLLGATFSSVALSHAQTVTIRDDLASSTNSQFRVSKHEALNHWEQFSTTLSASIDTAPRPGQETTLNGPTYNWVCYDPNFQLTAPHSQSTGLQNNLPSHAPTSEGSMSIPVSCTMTYWETDSRGNTVRTFSGITGNLIVTYWSRAPKIVVQTANSRNTVYNGATNPPYYGHQTLYPLQVQDNQNDNPDVGQRLPYGSGLLHEEFNVTQGNPNPNGFKGPYTAYYHKDGTGSPTANIVDNIGYISPTPPSNPFAIYTAFKHNWYCMELESPYSPAPPRNLYVTPYAFNPDPNDPDPNERRKVNPTLSDFLGNVYPTFLNTHEVVNYYSYATVDYNGNPYH